MAFGLVLLSAGGLYMLESDEPIIPGTAPEDDAESPAGSEHEQEDPATTRQEGGSLRSRAGGRRDRHYPQPQWRALHVHPEDLEFRWLSGTWESGLSALRVKDGAHHGHKLLPSLVLGHVWRNTVAVQRFVGIVTGSFAGHPSQAFDGCIRHASPLVGRVS